MGKNSGAGVLKNVEALDSRQEKRRQYLAQVKTTLSRCMLDDADSRHRKAKAYDKSI